MARTKTGNPKIAIGYLRVSTDDQQLGPDAQRCALEAWAARMEVQLVAIHVDHGVSGAAPVDQRPGLVAALAALRVHGAGVLVAAKRDRIARDTVIAAMVERAASKAGACVRTADGSSDASGPEGMMMRGVADLFAAYEREVIRARTRAALAVKRSRGEKLGGIAPYGFRLADDGVHLEAVEEEQRVLGVARVLRAEGQSLRAIVAELDRSGARSRTGGVFALTQVARMLRAA